MKDLAATENARLFCQGARFGAIGWLLLVSLVFCASCSQDTKLGRVHGTVRLDGKPVPKGTVQFTPSAGQSAIGTIQSDGSYSLETQGRSDGAFLGMNKVAIVSYNAPPITGPAYMFPHQKSTPLVPERYMSATTSGLTFDVKPGNNQADFDLTSK